MEVSKTRQGKRPGFFRRRWLYLKAYLQKRPLRTCSVSFDASGLTVVWCGVDEQEDSRREIAWRDVREVAVFKEDCFAWDLIFVQFARQDGSAFAFPEDATGFDQLLHSLPLHLCGCRAMESWWPEVVQPAFAENWTVIWSRDPQGSGVDVARDECDATS